LKSKIWARWICILWRGSRSDRSALGRNVTVRAILVSNALFSATHVHMMSGLLGVIVFIPGLFWGWLYARQGNLIGVSISHLFVGWTALFFLNLESLF